MCHLIQVDDDGYFDIWIFYIYKDNMSVIHNTSKPELILKEKCNGITYHATNESVAVKESLTMHIRSEDIPADLLTKVVTGKKRKHIVSCYMAYTMGYLTMGKDSFPDAASYFSDLIHNIHECMFERIRKLWL